MGKKSKRTKRQSSSSQGRGGDPREMAQHQGTIIVASREANQRVLQEALANCSFDRLYDIYKDRNMRKVFRNGKNAVSKAETKVGGDDPAVRSQMEQDLSNS
jgi:hypothetical protein